MNIFLDIDGVLATRGNYRKHAGRFDRECVASLNRLAKELSKRASPVQIVITSTWRYSFPLPELKEMLEEAGLEASVIGTTILNQIRGRRDEEILDWIEENNYKGEYIVIDDESKDMGSIPKNCFIYVKNGFKRKGLTQRIVEKFLNRYLDAKPMYMRILRLKNRLKSK